MYVSNIRERLEGNSAGNKAYNLSRLKNFDIPEGVVLLSDVYSKFLRSKNIYNRINDLVRTCEEGREEEVSREITSLIMHGELPKGVHEELLGEISTFHAPFAVRSSSTLEDSDLSFAGLFESVLHVEKKDLIDAIKKVYASMFSARALSYAMSHNIDLLGAKMAVLIQEMVTDAKYGVAFSFEEDGNRVIVIEGGSGDPAIATSGNSRFLDRYISTVNGIRKYPNRLGVNLLFDFELERLLDTVKRLSDFEFPLDIEWAMKDDVPYVLQIRRLTRKVPVSHIEGTSGIPASGGEKTGTVRLLVKNEDWNVKITKDDILVAEEIEVDRASIALKAGGICLEVPGMLNHAAILAREKGIPCIVGLDGITSLVHDRERIWINGTTGEIQLLDRKGFSIKQNVKKFNVKIGALHKLRHGKHMVLFCEDRETDSTIMFHVLRDKPLELQSVIAELSKINGRKPVLDGGIDVWYGYSTILEMSDYANGMREALIDAEAKGRRGDKNCIGRTFDNLLSKIEFYLKSAKKKFLDYEKTEKKRKLQRCIHRC